MDDDMKLAVLSMPWASYSEALRRRAASTGRIVFCDKSVLEIDSSGRWIYTDGALNEASSALADIERHFAPKIGDQ